MSNIVFPHTITAPKLSPRRSLNISLLGIFALVFLFLSIEVPLASAQSPPDNILGKVTNGTEGGTLPDDLEVLLLSIDLTSNQIIEQETTTVDADGIFRFSNLISGPGLSYRVVVNSGTYTPSVDMDGVENWENVRISIYDETTSLDEITISSYVLMIPTVDARSRQAGVLTVINVNNFGDEVWTPDLTDPNLTGFDLLRFNLPEGYSDLSVESELPNGNILEINTGFAITNPIPPGEAAILISYIVPYEDDSFDFTLKMPYGAGQVRMLLPDNAGTISADKFSAAESVVVAETVFNQYEANDFVIGDELVATFSGLPQPTAVQQLSDFFKGRSYVIVIIWIVGVALLAILGYAMFASRKKSKPNDGDYSELVSRNDIIAQIAKLDEDYGAGNIDQGEYNDRRSGLKSLVLQAEQDLISVDSIESQDESDTVPTDGKAAVLAESQDRISEESDK